MSYVAAGMAAASMLKGMGDKNKAAAAKKKSAAAGGGGGGRKNVAKKKPAKRSAGFRGGFNTRK